MKKRDTLSRGVTTLSLSTRAELKFTCSELKTLRTLVTSTVKVARLGDCQWYSGRTHDKDDKDDKGVIAPEQPISVVIP